MRTHTHLIKVARLLDFKDALPLCVACQLVQHTVALGGLKAKLQDPFVGVITSSPAMEYQLIK